MCFRLNWKNTEKPDQIKHELKGRFKSGKPEQLPQSLHGVSAGLERDVEISPLLCVCWEMPHRGSQSSQGPTHTQCTQEENNTINMWDSSRAFQSFSRRECVLSDNGSQIKVPWQVILQGPRQKKIYIKGVVHSLALPLCRSSHPQHLNSGFYGNTFLHRISHSAFSLSDTSLQKTTISAPINWPWTSEHNVQQRDA